MHLNTRWEEKVITVGFVKFNLPAEIDPLLSFCTGNAQEDALSQDSCPTANKQHTNTEERNVEVVRRAREEGRVDVVFPGAVTQNSCYHFVSEILKCILYQRQQLPMTYDQLVYSQKKQQTSAQVRGVDVGIAAVFVIK